MTRHDDAVSVRHMFDHAVEAVEMARGCSRADLDGDRQFNLALVRLVEIIGEAAKRVGPAKREGHPQVPWAQIIGTRDRLIHGYDRVNFDILWRIVNDELPVLIEQLQAILSKTPKTPKPGATPGFGFFGVQEELAQILKRKVDLNTPQCLSRYYVDEVLREARVLYDAA